MTLIRCAEVVRIVRIKGPYVSDAILSATQSVGMKPDERRQKQAALLAS